MIRLSVAAAVIVGLVVGCAGPGEGSAGLTGHPSLAGTSWRLVSILGEPLAPGLEVTLDFDVERLAGQAPCNSYAGVHRYDRDTGNFAAEQILSTKRACVDPAGSALEAAFLDALAATTEANVDAGGRLVLSGAGTSLVFVAAGQTSVD